MQKATEELLQRKMEEKGLQLAQARVIASLLSDPIAQTVNLPLPAELEMLPGSR